MAFKTTRNTHNTRPTRKNISSVFQSCPLILMPKEPTPKDGADCQSQSWETQVSSTHCRKHRDIASSACRTGVSVLMSSLSHCPLRVPQDPCPRHGLPVTQNHGAGGAMDKASFRQCRTISGLAPACHTAWQPAMGGRHRVAGKTPNGPHALSITSQGPT